MLSGLRLRDWILSTLGLILLGPVFLLIILLLLLTQKRVFYVQYRPGRNEQLFPLIKFSTLTDPPPGSDPHAGLVSRQTAVGRWLRRWSLDELPQLVNVWLGQMSLVGPRPLLADYLVLYTARDRIRHHVRPGLTGLAQVRGRQALTFRQKFRYDRWYVANRSPGLDCKILWETLAVLWSGKGIFVPQNDQPSRFDGKN